MYDSSSSEIINSKTLITKKRFLIWLNTQPTSPLTFADNLVYSVVARKPASKRTLAKLTGLCRKRTIPTAIDKLLQIGLCEAKDGMYTARQPDEQQLQWWQTWQNPYAKRWQDKVTYFKVFRPTPSSGLTVRQSCLFSKVLSWPGKLPSYYATCLGWPRRTAFRQLGTLRSMGLITKDGCRVPESIPDLWLAKPAEVSVVHPRTRRFLDDQKDGWLLPGQGVKKIEEASAALASHFGHKPKYLRRYWFDTLSAFDHPAQIEMFVAESGKMVAHVITKAKTRKYLVSTTALVIKHLQSWPVETVYLWTFDPSRLVKSEAT